MKSDKNNVESFSDLKLVDIPKADANEKINVHQIRQKKVDQIPENFVIKNRNRGLLGEKLSSIVGPLYIGGWIK